MPDTSTVNRHPQFIERDPDFIRMRDVHAGERTIKNLGTMYLPAIASHIEDGMKSPEDLGFKNYQAYKSRARFPDFVKESVKGAVGIMHHRPPKIELPPELEPLRRSATVQGEPLHVLLRKINTQQLIYGRCGLLADVASGQGPSTLPYTAIYGARTIINWDDGTIGSPVRQKLNLVVLDETEQVRDDNLSWQEKAKQRVLMLVDDVYHMATTEDGDFSLEGLDFRRPSIGGRILSHIPFTFINAVDLVPEPDCPPLLGLADLAVGVYQSEADYRYSLFMQGQDTLVIEGFAGEDEDSIRVGAGAHICVGVGGGASYVGVQSAGLSEQRSALENDRQLASEMGNKLLDTRGRESESGDALRMRVSARTANLNQIALTGAQGLEDHLRGIALWVGADPDLVKIVANQEFAEDTPEGRDLFDLTQAKELGAPISHRSIHNWLRERGMTRLSFEEEMAQIEEEEPLGVTDDLE